VTILLQRLHDELVRRHDATTTRESYLKILKAFQRHIGKRLDHVGPNDLRRYQVYLLEDRRLAVGTGVAQLAAPRDPYSSSIVGRRASGFLQVSLSKVTRHPHRRISPAPRAESPPMNANDYSRVIRRSIR
jgi:Phage integrase, N-terminal SAM-like domain